MMMIAEHSLLDDERWSAVRRRDPAADGQFVMSVRSTGIYCRPVCPAREPLRKNVAFHADWRAAEAAGFRACKRCTPQAPSKDSAHHAVVRDAIATIAASETPPTLALLAEKAGMSRFHFQRVFTKIVGITPKAYAQHLRERVVREQISAGGSITAAIYHAGYGSASRFYEGSGRRLGMKPSRLREHGVGETIHYTTQATSIGVLLVAATARGICAIDIADDAQTLLARFEERYARADRVLDTARLADDVRAIVASLDEPARGLDVPLDIAGTAFQRRVWQALRAIPVGSTRTYTQFAVELGAPQSARAVARACASNELAFAIPCHRVIRGDGSLAGYRWGLERKQRLLARETGD